MSYAIISAAAGLVGGAFFLFFTSAIKSKYAKRKCRLRGKATGKLKAARKLEFSKILAIWAASIATLAIAAPVALAAMDKQPVSDLAVTAFTACVGYLVTYAGKSAFEKNSRNKHHIDEDGKPYDSQYDSMGM